MCCGTTRYHRGMAPRIFLATIVVALAAACGRDIKKLMPPPELYASGQLDAFAGKSTDYTVFFATDRNVVETDEPKKRFGNERGGGLHVGRATVRIGGEKRAWSDVADESRAGRGSPTAHRSDRGR